MYAIPYYIPSHSHQQTQPPQPPATFIDYVNTLDKWEIDLLADYNLQYDKEDIIQILDTAGRLYFVSDGGKTDGLGYFGWVIATEMEILVKHKGHASRNPTLIESL